MVIYLLVPLYKGQSPLHSNFKYPYLYFTYCSNKIVDNESKKSPIRQLQKIKMSLTKLNHFKQKQRIAIMCFGIVLYIYT